MEVSKNNISAEAPAKKQSLLKKVFKGGKSLKRANELDYHLMLLPGVILTIIFCYLPMAGLTIAFQNFKPANGLFGPQEWTMENFTFLFTDPDVLRITVNTIIIAVCKGALGLIVPVIVAIMLYMQKSRGFRSFTMIIICLPHFISWVLISSMMQQMLSSTGFVNQLIVSLGGKPVDFLSNSGIFKVLVVLTDQWKEFGYGCIIYFSAILGIDDSLFEAADIDGAGTFRKIWKIIMPELKSLILMMAMLSLGNILNAGFDQIYNMLNNSVKSTGEILDTYIYTLAFGTSRSYSLSAAVGLVKSVISFGLISLVYWLSYKFANYSLF